MNRTLTGILVALLATAMWPSGSAQAQDLLIERGRFDANFGGGVLLHPNSSALVSSSPLLNVNARLFVTDNIGLGFSFDYARTETDDDIFPLAQFDFEDADSTLFVALKQPVSLFHYHFVGVVGAPMAGGSFYPYVTGGIGAYTIYLDPQQNDQTTRNTEFSAMIGAALKFRMGARTAFEISVRDVIYTDFDRDRLNPTPDRVCRVGAVNQFNGNICPNERFPFLDPERSDPNFSEPESTIHNFSISASLSFIPRL